MAEYTRLNIALISTWFYKPHQDDHVTQKDSKNVFPVPPMSSTFLPFLRHSYFAKRKSLRDPFSVQPLKRMPSMLLLLLLFYDTYRRFSTCLCRQNACQAPLLSNYYSSFRSCRCHSYVIIIHPRNLYVATSLYINHSDIYFIAIFLYILCVLFIEMYSFDMRTSW